MVLTKQEYRDLNLDLLLYKSELCNNKEDYVLRTADFNTEYRNSGYFARAYVYTNTKSGNTSIIFAHTVRNFEYIDISKYYSSAKSKVFINGILDKLIIDLKEKKMIKKTGRGLLEF